VRIAAQALAPALQILASERDVQVIYRSELVGDQRTAGVDGNFTFDEALTRLLNGTGLTYLYLADRAITLVPLPSRETVPGSGRKEKNGVFRARGAPSPEGPGKCDRGSEHCGERP
jgi:hypothetical protein